MTPSASLGGAGSAALPFLFPDATISIPGTTRSRRSTSLQPRVLGRHADGEGADVLVGRPVAQRAADRIGFPGWFNINTTQDFASA